MSDEIDTSEFDAAAAGLAGAHELVNRLAGAAVDDMAEAALVNVRRRRAAHRVTGKGERMITLRETGAGANRRAVVHAAGQVAPLIAGGTRRHIIRAAAGHALAFAGPARGFAANVRHPGTRADPFVHRGLEDTRPRVRQITDTTATRLASGLADELGGR